MKPSLRKSLREAVSGVVRKTLSDAFRSPEALRAFQEFGRIGGKKGGKIRAKRMTPEQRTEAARKAVQARWAKVKGKKPF